jgi:hypothetical protein
LPSAIVAAKAYRFFDFGPVISKFQRVDGLSLDRDIRDEFVAALYRKQQQHTKSETQQLAVEREIVAQVKSVLTWNELDWKIMKESTISVTMSIAFLKGDSIAYGRAFGIIDTSAEEALAWIWDYCSYERNRIHEFQQGSFQKYPRRITAYHSNSHRELLVLKAFAFPVSPRAFANHQVWLRENDGTLILAAMPCESLPSDIGTLSRKKIIEGRLWAFYRITAINKRQCTVDLIAKTDVRGAIPPSQANAYIADGLNILQTMSQFFGRDDELDAAARQHFIFNSLQKNQVYNNKETSLFQGFFSMFRDRNDLTLSRVKLARTVDPLIKISIGHVAASNDKYHIEFLRGETVVDVNFLEAAAWDWKFMSREFVKEVSVAYLVHRKM